MLSTLFCCACLFFQESSSAFLHSELWEVPLLSWDILLSSCFTPLFSCSVSLMYCIYFTFSADGTSRHFWMSPHVKWVSTWQPNPAVLWDVNNYQVSSKDSHGKDSRWSSKTSVATEHHCHRVAWGTWPAAIGVPSPYHFQALSLARECFAQRKLG